MYCRPIKIRDRILYTQVLTQADYVVHAITAIDAQRGGVMLRGSFEREGVQVDQLFAETYRSNYWRVGDRTFTVTLLAGGLFSLTEIDCEATP